MYKKVESIKVSDLPFQDFLTSRHSITVKVKAQKTYELSKKEDIPFFNLALACQLESINEIPEFKYRIIDDEVVEYNYITAVTPIMQEDNTVKEIEIKPPHEFKDIYKWNSYVENKKENIEENQYLVEPSKRDIEGIANFSCMPWLDFDSMVNIIASPNQLMPAITWGKLTDEKMPISISASHIFVYGWHFKLFYEKTEKYLNNPEILF